MSLHSWAAVSLKRSKVEQLPHEDVFRFGPPYASTMSDSEPAELITKYAESPLSSVEPFITAVVFVLRAPYDEFDRSAIYHAVEKLSGFALEAIVI